MPSARLVSSPWWPGDSRSKVDLVVGGLSIKKIDRWPLLFFRWAASRKKKEVNSEKSLMKMVGEF